MVSMRKESPQCIQQKTSTKKPKRRPIRLTGVSKQRRKANERERKRVQTLNSHIETLRNLIPLSPLEKRPTNTEVIWMAATYIEFLTELLKCEKPSEKTSETFAEVHSVSKRLDMAFTDVTVSDPFGLDEGSTSISELDLEECFFLTDTKTSFNES